MRSALRQRTPLMATKATCIAHLPFTRANRRARRAHAEILQLRMRPRPVPFRAFVRTRVVLSCADRPPRAGHRPRRRRCRPGPPAGRPSRRPAPGVDLRPHAQRAPGATSCPRGPRRTGARAPAGRRECRARTPRPASRARTRTSCRSPSRARRAAGGRARSTPSAEQPRDRDRVVGLVQQARGGAAGDVRAQADPHAPVHEAPDREHRVREVGVAQRAVGDPGAAVPDQQRVVVGHVVGVREDRAGPQQPEGVQRRAVGRAEPLEGVPVRPVRLRAVGLHERPGGGGELAEPPQQVVRAGRGEARRDDRPDEATPGVDGRDLVDGPRAGGDARRRRVVAVPPGRAVGMVHGHPADEARWPASTAARASAVVASTSIVAKYVAVVVPWRRSVSTMSAHTGRANDGSA